MQPSMLESADRHELRLMRAPDQLEKKKPGKPRDFKVLTIALLGFPQARPRDLMAGWLMQG
jgi:hypothetical protein